MATGLVANADERRHRVRARLPTPPAQQGDYAAAGGPAAAAAHFYGAPAIRQGCHPGSRVEAAPHSARRRLRRAAHGARGAHPRPPCRCATWGRPGCTGSSRAAWRPCPRPARPAAPARWAPGGAAAAPRAPSRRQTAARRRAPAALRGAPRLSAPSVGVTLTLLSRPQAAVRRRAPARGAASRCAPRLDNPPYK
jgi:hypothetical protein